MKRMNYALMATMAVLFTGSVMAEKTEDKLITTVREALPKYASSVIHASVVVKMTAEGALAAMMPDKDQTEEILITMIDDSGLAVTSLASVRPSSAFADIIVQGVAMKMTTKIISIKLITADGTEIAAKIILEDDELDLAFIAPITQLTADQKKLFTPLDISAARKEKLDIVDELFSISRLAQTFRRTPNVELFYVSSIIQKPRLFYYPGGSNPGTPVFDKNGALVGITLMKKTNGKEVSNGQMSMQSRVAKSTIIRPIADILEFIQQAKTIQSK